MFAIVTGGTGVVLIVIAAAVLPRASSTGYSVGLVLQCCWRGRWKLESTTSAGEREYPLCLLSFVRYRVQGSASKGGGGDLLVRVKKYREGCVSSFRQKTESV